MTFLEFIGIGEKADEGKRRMAMWTSLVCFSLMAASLSAESSWISGYLEFVVGGAEAPKALNEEFRFVVDAHNKARRLQNAPTTFNAEFHVGLSFMNRVSNFPMWYSEVQAWSQERFYLSDYLADINYAITSYPDSRWYGAKTFSQNTFDSTKGLVGFSAFVMLIVWLLMVLISYDTPGLPQQAVLFTKYGSLISAFFCSVALIYFDASGYKKEMCSAYDPDATASGKGCDYAEGFNCVLASTILSIALSIAMFRFVPDQAASTYSFQGVSNAPIMEESPSKSGLYVTSAGSGSSFQTTAL
jgi:hypothetical protein